MKTKRPTSFEVAKLAGVSRTTVSFVLNSNDKMNISAATRQWVLEAARELGYVPDVAGRNLASGRTRTLDLFICHAEHLCVDAFILQALLGIHQASQEHGFRVIVEAVEDPRQPDAYADLVRARQVDGLVVLNPRKTDHLLGLGHTRVAHITYGSLEYQGSTSAFRGADKPSRPQVCPSTRPLCERATSAPKAATRR